MCNLKIRMGLIFPIFSRTHPHALLNIHKPQRHRHPLLPLRPLSRTSRSCHICSNPNRTRHRRCLLRRRPHLQRNRHRPRIHHNFLHSHTHRNRRIRQLTSNISPWCKHHHGKPSSDLYLKGSSSFILILLFLGIIFLSFPSFVMAIDPIIPSRDDEAYVSLFLGTELIDRRSSDILEGVCRCCDTIYCNTIEQPRLTNTQCIIFRCQSGL